MIVILFVLIKLIVILFVLIKLIVILFVLIKMIVILFVLITIKGGNRRAHCLAEVNGLGRSQNNRNF